MSASQSGNFSTSHRVMHEPRGGEQAILPDQSKWARHGNCRTLGGASIWKPFPSNGRSSARLKILDRDPRPLGIKDVPVGVGEETRNSGGNSPRWTRAKKSLNHTCGGKIFHRDFYSEFYDVYLTRLPARNSIGVIFFDCQLLPRVSFCTTLMLKSRVDRDFCASCIKWMKNVPLTNYLKLLSRKNILIHCNYMCV